MKVEITGRHIEITAALREFAEEKLRKLERLLEGPLEAHAVLGIEKHRHTAEIQIKSRSVVLSGAEETADLYASISEVVDKLERQALKHKEKVHDHKHRRGPRSPEIAAAIEATAAEEIDEAAGGPSPVSPRIVRSASYRLKPLSPEDALLELESSGEELLVFRDAETSRVNVIYRLRNGDFGLVEPDF
jgi:putative sigma-54 modulation protein